MFTAFAFIPIKNKENSSTVNRQIGHCRFVYNKLLEIAINNFKTNGKTWNFYEYKKFLPKLKEQYPFRLTATGINSAYSTSLLSQGGKLISFCKE